MSKEVLGTGVIFKVKVSGGYIEAGCATAVAFNFQNELIGKTDVNASGGFRKRRIRMSDCSGSVSGIILTESSPLRLSIFHFLQEAVRRSELDCQFIFQDIDGGVKIIQGFFLVESTDLNGAQTGFGEFDLQLQGSGGISVSSVDDPGDIVCESVYSDWWTATTGQTGISGPGSEGRDFAGHRVVLISRSGTGHDIVDSGVPGNRQARYSGGASVTFDPANPFNDGETIYVEWVEDGS